MTQPKKMRNRDYKEFAAGEFYHIYNRGVGKMDIFIDEEDYKFFISRLVESVHPEFSRDLKNIPRRKLLPEKSFDLIAYCLMPNHYHLLIEQMGNLSISLLISKVCTSYSMYFNKKYKRVGSLFQDIFKSVRVEDNEQLLWLSAYIHNNPVKSGLTSSPFSYKWSSANEYLSPVKYICSKEIIMNQLTDSSQYQKILSNQLDSFANQEMISMGNVLIDY